MNIDYTAIITKANERKDALMRFEVAVQELGDQLTGSQPLLSALTEFKAATAGLDSEAHALLPENAVQPVGRFVSALLLAWGSAHDKYGYHKMTAGEGLALLVSRPEPL